MSGISRLILVVEDEPLIRMDIVDALEEAGYHVLEAGDAGEAIGLYAQHGSVSALLTDIDMPGQMNGLDLAALIRRQDSAIPIVVTSGRSGLRPSDLPHNGRFYPKPYRSREIVQGLASMLHAA